MESGSGKWKVMIAFMEDANWLICKLNLRARKRVGAPRCAVPARRERGGCFCTNFSPFFYKTLMSTGRGASAVENLASPDY